MNQSDSSTSYHGNNIRVLMALNVNESAKKEISFNESFG